MRGMSAETGASLEGDDHLRQSIADILTTPVGSRVMRREYGSELPFLIDQPMNPATRQALYAATAAALARWEPRIRLTRVTLASTDAAGRFALSLEYARLDQADQAAQSLTLPLSSLPSGA